MDGASLGTTAEQAYYVYSRLSGKAADRILPWITTISTTSPEELTVTDIMNQLERAFLDPNIRTKAVSKLSILRQKNRDIGEFLAEFEQVLIQAGGISWSDDVRMSYLYNALNAQMLQGLIGTPPAKSYIEFCTQLRTLEEQINRAQRAVKYSNHRTKLEPSGIGHQRAPETPMDWEPTKVGAVRQDGFKGRKRAVRVSVQEVERRRTNRLCIRCGEGGHFIKDCTMLPPARVRVAVTQEGADVEESTLDSGKE